ncbi:MAG: prepilin-type N-terminal cleavage/methylation domain-containing protein [Parcubacteria group bacterium]|nr:prepilin-type N-terminal cleavage/methylation domain-containing protein [Parcubacteria group bacterium]
MTKQNYSKGFTIIELTVTISIFIIVIAAVLGISFLGQRFYQQGEIMAEILQNGRIISERMTREIRQADELVTQLPQVPDQPDSPPPNEIEFQDGHTPSPYAYLGSEYYYIRYYIATNTNEVRRNYRVYCFDACGICSEYFRWNDTKMEGEVEVGTSACALEDRIIGEYVQDMNFWGAGLINISLTLQKDSEQIDLNTKVLGRNL